ncbi:hypothetical protein [uncultured Microbacterium sp.]|uniref:hypothetical protein n=1 Tax=Microbacterium algeriense TaxID=2615184 RepID=UPI0025990A3B|nr:hypothetical protein [uncultured Microbacterium sp.]
MRRRLAFGRWLPVGLLAIAAVATPSTAWGSPATQVIQGDVLRLVSVADWDAAAGMLPGQPLRWDVAVSAQAPDPGVIRIGISATGGAALVADVAMCRQAWAGTDCPGGATTLREDWRIPRDGAETPLAEIADTETAHLRLAITLDAGDAAGSTEVRIQARGAGETVAVGPDGGLAVTGASPRTAWLAAAGVLLALAGAALGRGRRVWGEPQRRTRA